MANILNVIFFVLMLMDEFITSSKWIFKWLERLPVVFFDPLMDSRHVGFDCTFKFVQHVSKWIIHPPKFLLKSNEITESIVTCLVFYRCNVSNHLNFCCWSCKLWFMSLFEEWDYQCVIYQRFFVHLTHNCYFIFYLRFNVIDQKIHSFTVNNLPLNRWMHHKSF